MMNRLRNYRLDVELVRDIKMRTRWDKEVLKCLGHVERLSKFRLPRRVVVSYVNNSRWS